MDITSFTTVVPGHISKGNLPCIFAFALHFALYSAFAFTLYSAHEAPLYGQTIVQ